MRVTVLVLAIIGFAQSAHANEKFRDPKAILPSSLEIATATTKDATARKTFLRLSLGYDDYNLVKTRPLLHLEARGADE